MATATNKFCRASDLTNEASVESFFVLRLLKDLGYQDDEVLTKKSIDSLKIPRGRAKENYKPDFIMVCRQRPRWLLDAKPTTDRIEDWTHQCAGYALQINRKYADTPLGFYVLSNGLLTRVYRWDQEEALLSLRFSDFVEGNEKYDALKALLGADRIRRGASGAAGHAALGHTLVRPSIDEVKKAFLRCHRIIWKSEKMSPQAAFLAFAKLLFVKLWEDRRLRDDKAALAAITSGAPIDAASVRYSVKWIERQEPDVPHPVDTILFQQLLAQLEAEIARKKRKRIFERGESLGMSPGTVKRVVAEIEDYYLFGIDEDLNGRMFEAFLSATMRGSDLGQYFTPRSIVKLMLKLGRPMASREHVDRVIDACCGTGGFLIEALTVMRQQVYANASLTDKERARLLNEIANEALIGVDAGRDPPLARIARINMYLHGDGGSRVYVTDGLRREPESSSEPLEVQEEVAELRRLLSNGLRFDVVLTNPPFSMDYSETDPAEKAVLEGYSLGVNADGRRRASLRSAIMFIERYHDLLRPGGRLLAVIDDSILSGRKESYVRDFIRTRFIVRGIVSIHGDAFRRAGARVKTSMLYLEKRSDDPIEQPALFVYETKYVGVDDVVPRTPPSVAERARSLAVQEIGDVGAAFDAYLSGRRGPWLVPAERASDRLDAKHLLPWKATHLKKEWLAAGAVSTCLSDLLEPVENRITLAPHKEYTFLRVSYAGHGERGEKRRGDEVSYRAVGTARRDDLVISNISAVWGAICVLTEDLEDALVTPESTVLRLKAGVRADPHYLWAVLRSPAVIAEWRSSASGMVARQRIDWDRLKSQEIPIVKWPLQKQIGDLHRKTLELERQAQQHSADAADALSVLKLDSEEARDRMERAKPPR